MLYLLLVLTGWAAYTQFSSPAATALSAKSDETLYIAVLSNPSMFISYNPATQKAAIRNIRVKGTGKNYHERARQLLDAAGVKPQKVHYYAPLQTDKDEVWEKFKNALNNWQYNPLKLPVLFYTYARAWHEGRTNINPGEMILYAMDLSRLQVSDFSVKIAEEIKKKGKNTPEPVTENRAPLAVDDRPLIVEILNASGRKGIALELTQYLRRQNEKGLLRVDVLQYDNYPGGLLDITRIIDFSGRMVQVKQLSTAVGNNSEILSERKGNAICDVRIIVGKDFQMPL